jgi:hypothetical protein
VRRRAPDDARWTRDGAARRGGAWRGVVAARRRGVVVRGVVAWRGGSAAAWWCVAAWRGVAWRGGGAVRRRRGRCTGHRAPGTGHRAPGTGQMMGVQCAAWKAASQRAWWIGGLVG